jgi:hypothetical protein
MLPSGTKCPTNAPASNSSRSTRSTPCTNTFSQLSAIIGDDTPIVQQPPRPPSASRRVWKPTSALSRARTGGQTGSISACHASRISLVNRFRTSPGSPSRSRPSSLSDAPGVSRSERAISALTWLGGVAAIRARSSSNWASGPVGGGDRTSGVYPRLGCSRVIGRRSSASTLGRTESNQRWWRPGLSWREVRRIAESVSNAGETARRQRRRSAGPNRRVIAMAASSQQRHSDSAWAESLVMSVAVVPGLPA